MKKMLVMFCVLIAGGLDANPAPAAVGKCTVVKVDGERMVIECNQQTKGFSQGTQIKIKSDKQKTAEKR